MLDFLNRMRDVSGLPFYPIVFQSLMVLTFAIHIIFVNLVIGGTTIALWCRINSESSFHERLSRALARANTIFTSIAIVMGVAPLLFVQVIYDPFWYTSAQMSAWWTLIFLLAIAVSFTSAYIFYLGNKEKSGSLFWSILSLTSLIIAMIIIHTLSVQMLHPERWKDWIAPDGKVELHGWQLNIIDLPRLLHFILPSIAVTGVYLMLYGWYYKNIYSDAYTRWVAKTGLKIAIYASCLQALAGIIWLLTSPKHFIFHPITLIGAISAAAFVGYILKLNPEKAREKAISTASFLFVVTLLMSITREFLRYYILSSKGYELYSYKINLSIGSTLLFFLTFIMGIIVISYPLTLAFNAGKSEKPISSAQFNKLGKIAAYLPVLWLAIVVLLGIAVSLNIFSPA